MIEKFENFESDSLYDKIIIGYPSGNVIYVSNDNLNNLLNANLVIKNDDKDSLQVNAPNLYFYFDFDTNKINDFIGKHKRYNLIYNFLFGIFRNEKYFNIKRDGSIDIIGSSISLMNKGYSEIPYKFASIGGSFYCSENYLINLKNAPDYVEKNFDCSENKIYSLKGSPYVEKLYNCSSNNIQNLEGIINGMTDLKVDWNKISKIDYESIKSVETLSFTGNMVNNLDGISLIENLKSLKCDENFLKDCSEITHLKNLKELYIGGNNIKKLPPLPTSLEVLSCRNCELRFINDIEELSNLKSLYCGDNFFDDEYAIYLKDYCLKNKIYFNNDKSTRFRGKI